MKEPTAKTTGREASTRQRKSVACFYCDEKFRRTQDRATHIRHHHPGKPYRPDLEQAQKGRAFSAHVADFPPTAPAVSPIQSPAQSEGPVETLSPKQHLVAAITEIKRRQDAVQHQLPDVEQQLESLRSAQKEMERERQALETALATIDGTALELPKDELTAAQQ